MLYRKIYSLVLYSKFHYLTNTYKVELDIENKNFINEFFTIDSNN